MTVTPIAIVGVGKIARDQHIPSIAANPEFELAATVSGHGGVEGTPSFPTIAQMMEAMPEVKAVAICTPPLGRLKVIEQALEHKLDILAEKPPAATLSEAEEIVRLASRRGQVLYATWHSRTAAAVAPARQLLGERKVEKVQVTWKEDVRVWHPGQEWIWEPGIGVFDPGINALSVMTRILPSPLLLASAELRFPENRAAPIAADLSLTDGDGTPVTVAFDFDQRGPQSWDIDIETTEGDIQLREGAARLFVDGQERTLNAPDEYPALYARFAQLIASRESEADLSPFRLVNDAFLLGRRTVVASFNW